MTPRVRAAADNVRRRFRAPRILYAPVRCRFSYFSHTSPPHKSENVRERRQGVSCTRPSRRAAAAWTSARVSSGVTAGRFGLPQSVVAVVLHEALDHFLRQQQPLAAAAWTPLGELFAHLLQRHRRVAIGEKDPKNRFERRHIAVDVVLRSTAVLADAFERIAAVGSPLDLEAHAAGGLVKDGRALFDLLTELGATGITQAAADDVFE